MRPDPTQMAAQAAFRNALWQDAPPDGLSAPDPEEIPRRFAVYRNNVHHGLSQALAARFPVVERLLGTDFFGAMARAFIKHAPPPDPVLLRWGAALPCFLEGFPPVGHLPWLADVARLELMRGRAYHAADAEPIRPGALATTDPERLILGLHPSVTLFASDYPAVTIWRMNTAPDPSHAVLKARPEHALIARSPDFAIVTETLDEATHGVLAALATGAPLGRAATRTDPTAALTLLLRHGLIVAARTGDPT
ncbi:MAG: putative DNA-binding domain-containing protein [Rhodobacteraceae bacterium]|nr:putative DNA-binding domain-containing protein [Paracoccaceae bacterium]